MKSFASSGHEAKYAQAARMLETKEQAAAHGPKAKISVDYEIGDAVKVLTGDITEGSLEQISRHV